MNIIGKWKVKELLFPTRNGMESYTPENLPVGDHADEIIMMLTSITQFTEDGLMKTLMRVPEDKIELAKSQGAVIDEDGFAAIEQTTWKEKDGKFYYDTKVKGNPGMPNISIFRLKRCGLKRKACFLSTSNSPARAARFISVLCKLIM